VIIRYVEDGTERVWDNFKPDRMMSPEAEVIEKITGMSFTEWGQALLNGRVLAGRALVFVLKKREDPTIRFRDVAFPVGDLKVDLDEDEKKLVREALATADLDDEEREQALAALGPEPAADDTDDTDEEPADGQGNAPSGSGPASATSASSPTS
jgi:hypothetical protein